MNELTTISINNMEKEGKYLYQTNEHYRQLATIMEHPEFRGFYEKNMSDMHKLLSIMMFMKLYEVIEKQCNIELTPYQKLAIVHSVVTTPRLRQKVIKDIMNWASLSNDKNRKCIVLNNDPKFLKEH